MRKLTEMHGPIDRTAARVLRSGVHFEKNLPLTVRHWRDPPPVTRYIKQHSQAIDLTGRKFGLFTVIGYLGSGRDGAMWLVRCTCGDYEARKTQAIKNPNNSKDRCHVCRDAAYQRGERL